MLASCYRESLKLAVEHGISTIAFPSIATGAHEFPGQQACEIAVATVQAWLEDHEMPREVWFCCYSPEDAGHYRRRLGLLENDSIRGHA